MMRLGKRIVLGLFGIVFLGVFINANVYAVDDSLIMKKWVFSGYAQCVPAINTPLRTLSSTGSVAESVFSGEGIVNYPSYGFGRNGNLSESVNCKDLFTSQGAASGAGVLNLASGLSDAKWENPEAAKKFLVDGVGYTFEASGGEYFTIAAKKQTCSYGAGSSYCVDKETYSAKVMPFDNGNKYTVTNNAFKDVIIDREDNGIRVKVELPSGYKWDNPDDASGKFIEFSPNIKDFANAVDSALKNWEVSISYHGITSDKYTFSAGEIANQGTNGIYEFNKNSDGAVKKSVERLSGLNDLNLTESERYRLYTYYINKLGTVNCGSEDVNGSSEFLVKLKSGSEFKNCKVTLNVEEYNPSLLYVYDLVSSGNGFPEIKQVNLDTIIEWMNTVDTSKLVDIDSLSSTNTGVEDGSSIREMCEKADLNGQGWILCPALENMTYTASAMDSVIQGLLSIDTSFYDYDSGTYQVWQVMRSFANILMIVFLLFIIFSQITGFGIDNYGIKKMLPRLIVAAILINLSFVICMVAVDLSNILGVGLRDLFGVIGSSLDIEQGGSGQGFIDFVVQSLFAVGATGAAVAPTVGAVVAVAGTAPLQIAMMVIIIVLALVGVLVAIFMFFVSLSARMIIVILCVAVAPVAFALYVLPNTQNVFKRWMSAFKAALVIFPICGALGGISELIKGIARGTTDWVMLVIGMVAPFMVFFLLPSLLRNTLSAMGQIGSAFQALSQKVSNGWQSARGAIEKTGMYRDAMEQAKANRAKKIRDSLNDRMNNGTFARNPFERAINESRYKTAARRAGFNEVTQQKMYEDQLKYASEDDRAKALASSIEANNIDRAIAAVNQMKANGQTAKAMEVLGNADLSGLIGNDRQRFAAVLQQSGSDPMVGYGIHLSAANDDKQKRNFAKSFKDYMSATDKDGYAARLFDKGQELSSKFTKDDWKTLHSSGTIRIMASTPIPFKDESGNDVQLSMDEQQAKLGSILGAAAAQGRSFKDDHRGTINQAIKDSGFTAGMLNWSPEQLIGLRLDTVQKLEDNYEGDTPEVRKQKLLSDLAPQIKRMASDNRIRNRMDEQVLDYFGIQTEAG